MLITNKDGLTKYSAPYRLWQGIPGIEVTKKGRIFLTFYSGGTKEQIGNYVVLLKSDDGVKFSEPIAVAFSPNHRCYDPCLWIDPLGRLWFAWAYAPNHAVYAVVCDDPDADELHWSEEIKIGKDVMMNKPTVLSTGEWLFPIAVWNYGVRALESKYDTTDEERKSFAYKSINNGKSFEKLGGADVENRSFDEHMILELKDGRLAMFVRTTYGIGVSYSFDRGRTWTQGEDSGLGGPCSRFFIRRLKSGRILLINHCNFEGRNNLTAMLSEDECKTWKHKLLLDERSNVSYPDAVEGSDGYIYITYDRERGAFLHSMDELYSCSREILIAKITENDIIEGKIISKESRLKCIASKLGKYAVENENPFDEVSRYSDNELAKHLYDKSSDEIISFLFEHYQINCINMYKVDNKKLDLLIEELKKGLSDKEKIICEIITLIRSVTVFSKKPVPVVERIKCVIQNNLTNDLSVKKIAEELGISQYYMCHLFKKATGVTIIDYKNELKITKAKNLLINSNRKITDISQECGFGSDSYFAKLFTAAEKVSPTQYRKLLKNNKKYDKDVIYDNMLKHINLLYNINIDELSRNKSIKTYEVSMPSEKYEFLHEAAIVKYHNVLIAAWYNNRKSELQGETPIRFSCSVDDGQTWSEAKTVVEDVSGKILYCPPVFGVCGDKLYMLLNQMVAPDHIHSLDLYMYNEKNNSFELLWSRPIPFKLNTNTYTLNNGKLILPGRIAELDGFPNTPAVLISDSGKIDDNWRLVKIQKDGSLADESKLIHPEVSLIAVREKIYAFTRNDERMVPLVYISENNGEEWKGPYAHDISVSASKIYSGTLSDKRNYIIANVGRDRSKLVILFSEAETMRFNKGYVLQDSFSEDLKYGTAWHYPSAYESDGKLYVIYTVNVDSWSKRGAVVSVIDLSLI